MTIEEKAKAYDKALKIAKKNYDVAQDLCNGSQIGVECFKNTLTNIFPELGESEYERIRKRLIDLIYKVYAFTNYITCVEYENIIAWLEKQGDTTSDIRYDGVNAGASLSVVNGNSFDYEKATITQKDFAPEEEMVGEAKSKLTPFDKKVRDFLFSFYLKVSDGMPLSEMIEAVLQLNTILFEVEQKQEWSEEDKEMLDRIDDSLEAYATKVRSEKDYELEEILKEEQSWLYSLKDRILPQPMQEWSEEDEKKRNLLINILNVNHPNGYFKANPANTLNMEAIHTEELVSWLKSIKEKVQPKQEWSEEDDYNLQCMIAKVTSDIQKGNVGRNNELIDWLKSLKDRMKGKEE